MTELRLDDADLAAVIDCLSSGWLTMGPRTQAFEETFATRVGVPNAVAVSSTEAALHLGLLAAGAGPGREVIVPAFGFPNLSPIAKLTGARVVPVDVTSVAEPHLDPAAVNAALRGCTCAIVVGHFAGYPADVRPLRTICDKRELVLIEDATDALGASASDGRSVGTAGHIGCFSLSTDRQLAVGEAGVVVCAERKLAKRLRRLRSHGMTSSSWDRHRGHELLYEVTEVGFNYRLDEPRAALASSRMRHLDADIQARRAMVGRFLGLLANNESITLGCRLDALDRASPLALLLLSSDSSTCQELERRLLREGARILPFGRIRPLIKSAVNAPVSRELEDRMIAVALDATQLSATRIAELLDVNTAHRTTDSHPVQ